MAVKTIEMEHCIDKMQEIMDWFIENKFHLRYFAILYLHPVQGKIQIQILIF